MRDLLDGLTRSQRVAVTHPASPMLLLGGAGTGKTACLTRRFAWLVGGGAPAASTLALTHSSVAAEGMRERLETLIEQPYDELHVHAIEGFSARLLRDEALEAGLDPFFSAVSRADRLALLLERIDELTLRRHEIRGNPAPLLVGFVDRIDRLKAELVTAADFRRHAESLAPPGSELDDAGRAGAARELEFAAVYSDHDRLLAERGAVDAGELVIRAFRLLHERPQARARVAERFRHVLVDDYQDVTFGGAMLLGLLWEGAESVTAAGDDDQAIRLPGEAAQRRLRDFERELHDATVIRLDRSLRCSERVLAAAEAVTAPLEGRLEKPIAGEPGGRMRFWRCRSERAQAQAAAGEIERLTARDGVAGGRIAVLVASVKQDGAVLGAALEERAVPFRLAGADAYFQRAEVRDVLAWMRLLADPGDSGAVVRALSRPPFELRSVDIARLTQVARRRKLDMVSAIRAALEGPQLSPEGRDRAAAFLKLYRSAATAFEDRRPDAFVLRLIERIGLRRQQVFATQAGTVERLRNIAALTELATAYVRREPHATPREFARYLTAVADSGLGEDETSAAGAAGAVRVMGMEAAKGLDFDHVFLLGLSGARVPGPPPPGAPPVPIALVREEPGAGDPAEEHAARMRRLVHVAMTRARVSLVLAWAEAPAPGERRASALYEEARAAAGGEEEVFEEELFGPAEGLHSTFRIMRDELLDTVSRVGGRLGEMRLDTYLDVSSSVARYLELLKVAALIERSRSGQSLDEAIGELNQLLEQAATPEQREILRASALDSWLRDTERALARRPAGPDQETEPSLDPFIPRRGDGLMLSASDIDTYRVCPLKYKFARVFRIPQEPTIHQRFGIALHQVLERFHAGGGGTREALMELFESSWRRGGFGDSDDEQQWRERARDALARYWDLDRRSDSAPVWFERSFSFRLGPHLLRGRVDRVDRHPDGSYELIDYKTGKAKTEEDLREDLQLSIYQMGARESWGLETSAQSYLYVLTGERVPVKHSEGELQRVRATVGEIADGIMQQDFEPKPSEEICSFCDYRIICPAAER